MVDDLTNVYLRIMPQNTTDFTSGGYGVIMDAISCTVTEELNGAYELEMTYPITGLRYKYMELRNIIVSKTLPYIYETHDGKVLEPQAFRIYEISKPINGIITIRAEHIRYDMGGYYVDYMEANGADATVDVLNRYTKGTFSVSAPEFKDDFGTFKTTVPRTLLSLLGGEDPSLVSTYGGELLFDNFEVTLLKRRGNVADGSLRIEYGKNMTEFTSVEKSDNIYTSVFPFYYSEEYGHVELPEKTVAVPGNFNFERVYLLDLSSEWDNARYEWKDEYPTIDELRDAANTFIEENNLGNPISSMEVNFLAMRSLRDNSMGGYKFLEKIWLGDEVNVVFNEIGVNGVLRCTKITYNVITDSFDSITLGEIQNGLTASVGGLSSALSNVNSQSSAFYSSLNKSFNDLSAISITTENLVANVANISTLTADNAIIENLQTVAITTDVIDARNAILGYVNAKDIEADAGAFSYLRTDNLEAKYVKADDIVAETGTYHYLTTERLRATYADLDFTNVHEAVIGTALIKDDAVTDSKILSLTANKITAGTIDAEKIQVVNLNASNLTVGTINGERIGKGSIELEKLSEEVPTKEYLDEVEKKLQNEIDGTIETFTTDTIPLLSNYPASSWKESEYYKHVGDICYVVNAANSANGFCYRFSHMSDGTYSWQLIKDSEVTKALQELIDVQGDISGIKTFNSSVSSFMTHTNEELSNLQVKNTEFETELGKKVAVTTFNEVKQTVEENSSTITTLSKDNDTTKSTINEIKQTQNSITTKVSQLEESDTSIKNSITAVEQGLNNYKISVAETYSTKSDLNNLEIGGRNYYHYDGRGINSWNMDGLTVGAFLGECNYGFYATGGNNGGAGVVRLSGYITSNGWWTVSFDVRGTQSTTLTLNVDICDLTATNGAITIPGDNMWHRYACSCNVTNYSGIYNFVDFGNFMWAYYLFRDIKIEKGNKATGFSPNPDDVQSQVSANKAAIDVNSGQIALKVSSTDYTGATIASLINQEPDSIKIQAKNLQLTGAITISSFSADLANDYNAVKSNASAGVKEYTSVVDLTGLSANVYYPVVCNGSIPANGKLNNYMAYSHLDRSASWSTHGGGGFSCNVIAAYKASGWGTTDGMSYCIENSYAWCLQQPAFACSQITSSSQVVFMLRGGGSYNMTAPTNTGWTVFTAHTDFPGSQYIAPVSWPPSSMAGNTIGCLKLTRDANLATWAAANDTTKIEGSNIYAGSVTTVQLAASAVTAEKIAAGTITADKIAAGTITANKIDVNNLFAQAITATGSITGAILYGSSFQTKYDANSAGQYELNEYGLTGYYSGTGGYTLDMNGLTLMPYRATNSYFNRSGQLFAATSLSSPLIYRNGTEIVDIFNQKIQIGLHNAVIGTDGRTVPSGSSWTNLASFSMGPGLWLMIISVSFSSNATGYRSINISTSSAGSPMGISYWDQRQAVSGAETICRIIEIFETSSGSTTYYVNARQGSGAYLTANTRATRINIR